ncbi:hypothetical protein [Coleofasciculus sp.]|uniref:hypothetical protein n=1 Tax=Coleofasciculus sp. TaxID=3100458 RepID=UPI0039FA94BF
MSNLLFSHCINPFTPQGNSEYGLAQKVTFASMRRALIESNAHNIGVEIIAVVYPEDEPIVEPPAIPIPKLCRSVQDFQILNPVRRLPLLKDILDIAALEGKGDYLIFSNIDISLQPHFYLDIKNIIEQSDDNNFACTITRRNVSSQFKNIKNIEQELSLMYAANSHPHPGCDCFIFPRRYVKNMNLGNITIAVRHFDQLLLANLDAISGFNFHWYRNLFLTFHIGNDRTWVWQIDYEEFNLNEALKAMEQIRKKFDIPKGSACHRSYKIFKEETKPTKKIIRQLKRISLLVKLLRWLREDILHQTRYNHQKLD